MGIYDRDYYRKSGPRYLDALSISGKACQWLIIINIVVYVLQLVTRPTMNVPHLGRLAAGDGPITDWFILDPESVLHGEVWRLLTYAFLHSTTSWEHIVFNLLFLWWFGSDVEGIYGTKEFLAFYLVSAFLGGLAFEAWSIARATNIPCLGASGAVTAVMVLCACHFPRKIILVFFVLPVPIWLFVLFLVGRDAWSLLGNHHTGTAVQVHLAGAAFAFVYFKTQWRVLGILPSMRAWRKERSRPRLRVVRPDSDSGEGEAVAVATAPAPKVDEQFEAKVDAVLEKVARHGQASLTESERQILLRASEVYKRRRS